MERFDLSFEVDGDNFTAAGEASSSTKAALRKLGLPTDLIRRVAICMYEGEINQVIHATGGHALVAVDATGVTITLKDNGPGIPDISKALEEGYSTATNEIREKGFGAGMGLPNMKRYADEFDITSEMGVGTTVVMKIKLPQ